MDNPAFDPVTLARLQFAVTALFHILWPVLAIGLSCFILVAGLPLEFEFGTNWSGFAVASGDLVGAILGFEASLAFMLKRLSRHRRVIDGWRNLCHAR